MAEPDVWGRGGRGNYKSSTVETPASVPIWCSVCYLLLLKGDVGNGKLIGQQLRCRGSEQRVVFLTGVSVIQPGQIIRADLSQAGSQAGVVRVGVCLFNPDLSAVALRE